MSNCGSTLTIKHVGKHVAYRIMGSLILGSITTYVLAGEGIPAGTTPTTTTINVAAPEFLLSTINLQEGTGTVTGVVTWKDENGKLLATAAVGANVNEAIWSSTDTKLSPKSILSEYHGDCTYAPSDATAPFPYPGTQPRRAPQGRAVGTVATGILLTGSSGTIEESTTLTAQVLAEQNPVTDGNIAFHIAGQKTQQYTPDQNGSATATYPPGTFTKPGVVQALVTYGSPDYAGSANCLLLELQPLKQ